MLKKKPKVKVEVEQPTPEKLKKVAVALSKRRKVARIRRQLLLDSHLHLQVSNLNWWMMGQYQRSLLEKTMRQ
jgi:hypothetical protein